LTTIDPEALVDPSAVVGPSTVVWGHAQIRENAVVGAECTIGRGAYIGAGVRLGDRVKVQNLALVYEPAELADGVFIGPGVVLTNDQFPRAVSPDGERIAAEHWEPVGVTVLEGASIGARAVCVAPVTIGRWAMVGAGAVVVHDVPDHALVVGSPARFLRWVGRFGRPLVAGTDGRWTCPATSESYTETDGKLRRDDD